MAPTRPRERRFWWIGCGRGDLKKDDLGYGERLKGAAPSPDLRKWFDHDEGNEDVEKLEEPAAKGDGTLLYPARDRDLNHARGTR